MIPLVIVQLQSLVLILNRWIALFIFAAGVLGNVSNVFVFTSRALFKQSISWYFVGISVNNLGIFLIGLSTRILDEGFQVVLFGGGSDSFCRVRTYLVYTLFSISSWLVVGATLDRFYSTNLSALKRQRFCSISMARKSITLLVLVCSLIHVHLLFFYRYVSQLTPLDDWKLSCLSSSSTYNLFFAFFILVFYSLLPPVLISIIGLLTLKNLHRSRRQIHPSLARRHRVNQLLKTLFIQILMLIIFTTPHSAYWIYMALTSLEGATKGNVRREYERFALNIVRLLLYVNYGSSFFLQYLLSASFRRDVSRVCLQCKRRLTTRE